MQCPSLFEFFLTVFISEYYPQNIAFDKRVQRGSTFAAMVIPAGTSPDTMVMDKSAPMRRRQVKVSQL